VEVRDVLVTEGTVRLGRRVVERLRAEGIERRAMSQSGRLGIIQRSGVASSRLGSYLK
jgi:hypothetical protein